MSLHENHEQIETRVTQHELGINAKQAIAHIELVKEHTLSP